MTRALLSEERERLEVRERQLDPWLGAGDQRKILAAVTTMLIGFMASRSLTIEDAKVMAATYVTTLGPIPTWGVEWACRRFSTGTVNPDEIGEKSISSAFAPTAAQVAKVARAVVTPFGQERERIRRVIAAADAAALPAPAAPATSADQMMPERWIAEREEQKRQKNTEAALRPDPRTPKQKHEDVLRAWAAMGLDPPKVESGKYLALPTTYLALGWTIREVGTGDDVRRSLMPPAPRDEESPEVETRPVRSGSFRQAGAAARAVLDEEIPF